ncbi:uncharacterized protein TNCV_541531 [Trichonephila clavipes]|nr:uncharacterized protein TNCV_541531 [Trichonephila clavipes]
MSAADIHCHVTEVYGTEANFKDGSGSLKMGEQTSMTRNARAGHLKSDTKYTDSKNRLLSLFKESENLRIKRLLTGIELGDMKPSQLLQKLKTVATSDISDNLIKTLWLEKLPESIKNILVVSDENLSKLAVMADKISDMTPRTEIFATENL